MREGKQANILIIVSSGMRSNCVFSACRRRLRYINNSTSFRDEYLDERHYSLSLVQIRRLLERIANHRHDTGNDVEVLEIQETSRSDIHAMNVGRENADHNDHR